MSRFVYQRQSASPDPSPGRPHCPNERFAQLGCGSCQHVNSDYAAQLKLKFEAGISDFKNEHLMEKATVLPAVESPKKLNYRCLFKLATHQDTQGKFIVGLYEPGSHKISSGIEQCPIHHENLINLLGDLKNILDESSLKAFDEKNHLGDLRYIVARTTHLGADVMLTFVVLHDCKRELLRITQQLRKLGHRITCCYMNIHSEVGNEIFGPITRHLYGDKYLRETVCGIDLNIPATGFFQINPWQAEKIYSRIQQHVGAAGPANTVWDLYCGIGPISLALAQNGFNVLGLEENSAAVEVAKSNAQKNNLERNCQFLATRVEDLDGSLPVNVQNPNHIVVNPSRRGIAENARSLIAHKLKHAPKTKLYYLSCDHHTMIRDMVWLKKFNIHLRQLEAFDMFAYTDKLEWLGVLSR